MPEAEAVVAPWSRTFAIGVVLWEALTARRRHRWDNSGLGMLPGSAAVHVSLEPDQAVMGVDSVEQLEAETGDALAELHQLADYCVKRVATKQ